MSLLRGPGILPGKGIGLTRGYHGAAGTSATAWPRLRVTACPRMMQREEGAECITSIVVIC
jgi:hypothetical protein